MTQAPSGTVTFLFTDIEGSTAKHEARPEEMAIAVARHDEIVRGAIEGNGGYVFATGGDAFCAAFATSRDAIRAALSAERALSAEAWPEGVGPVRVRMGLHTGMAEERGGNYYGSPLNRTARLMSAGHGGQVLLSDATYNLVRDHLSRIEPEAELRDLGEHRLKDLKHTEHVFQLVVPDLPDEFPPLKTHGLVTPVAEFVDLDRRFGEARYIGGGGMGDVYLARHGVLDRDMALKILKSQYANDKQFVERFRREARSAASLSHPNIATVYDAGEGVFGGERVSYLAMEYVPGGTLKDMIVGQRGPLPVAAALGLALQVARALEAAHGRGVIHRDVKPQNILLTEEGAAKVVDFGIAKAAASSTTITRAGGIVGTPHYISSEQVMGEPASPGSDLYSLGVVLYEMLTGELPYDADTPIGVVMKHVHGELRPPREANADVPEGLNAVCVRLLAKDPGERYGDAQELIGDLERVRQGGLPAFVSATQESEDPHVTPVIHDDPITVPSPREETSEDGREEALSPDEGRYRRLRSLASGRLAEVYLARDRELGRDVALKVLHHQYAEDEEFVQRFRREAESASSLSHPNIVAVLDHGREEDGSYYMSMEYVPGGTLEGCLREEGPLPLPEAVSLASQVARALQAAHERGIVHRDVKSQNVLLTEEGTAKVADFGIAKAAQETSITQEGAILGSAPYVSPEQALGRPVSPRSDLYSLGVVLYETLTGVQPFEADTPVGVIMGHVNGSLRPPNEIRREIPDSLNAACVRLLAKDPEGRHPDARSLAEELEQVLGDETRPADDGQGRVRVPDLAGLDLSGAGAALAAAGLGLGGGERTRSETAPEGQIVGQEPSAGTDVERGTAVVVKVSAGTSTGQAQEGGRPISSGPGSGGGAPPTQPPPPIGPRPRYQDGRGPRRRAPAWVMAAAGVLVLALIGAIFVVGGAGQRDEAQQQGEGGQQSGGQESDVGAAQGETGVREITLSFGPDASGTVQALVDRFNDQYEGEYEVNYREMPSDSGQYFEQISDELQAGGGDVDVIAGDVIWLAQFADDGYAADLSERLPSEEREKFMAGPMDAMTYEGKVYGVPWYMDAGMLYYRKDLLEQSGFSGPPTTWDELKAMALKTKQDTGTRYGFVFQGANYEGGVVDGLEYIWTHGGDVLDPDDPTNVVVDSPEAAAGLETERSMIVEGVAPAAVADFTETESGDAFLQGDAVFCRNWPYLYALSSDPEYSNVDPEQIGIAPLPVADAGDRSFSGLGGWQFMINSSSEEEDAAYEFIEFATSAEQQRILAMEAAFLPTRKELYEDQELLDQVAVMALGKEALENARPRPLSPHYPDMSLRMAEQFNKSLTGATSPEQAVQTLQEELTSLVE